MSTNNNNKSSLPPPGNTFQAAFDRTVQAVAKDMPLLMHGSGDVLPHQVSPEATHLLSALTVQYLGRLVSEALSAHEMLMDGDRYNTNTNNTTATASNVKVFPPPPVFVKSRLPETPLPPERLQKRKNINSKDEFWDEPMKAPKIVKLDGGDASTKQDDELQNDRDGQKTDNKTGDAPVIDSIHIDEWVGLAGIDLLENQTRKAFVRGTAGLTTQSFVFPICHDVYAYGRVTQVQKSERLLEPVLMDPIVQDMVQAESKDYQRLLRLRQKKSQKRSGGSNGSVNGGNNSDLDEDDDVDEIKSDQEEEDGSVWPGFEALLPIYRGFR